MDKITKNRIWYLNTDTDAVEYLARTLCVIAGFGAIDRDGNPNWWMFNEDATKIVNDLRKRFPVGSLSSE